MPIMTVAFASDYYDEEASVRSPITYAQLVGITNSGHDHSSWMSSAETYLLNCGEIDDVAKHTGAFTIAAINGYMNVNSYKVFIMNKNLNAVVVGKAQVVVHTVHPLDSLLDTLAGGNTAKHRGFVVLLFSLIGQGGKRRKTINCSKANSWTIAFCQKMSSGYSVQTACTQLAGMTTYASSGLQNWVLCGSGSTTIY